MNATTFALVLALGSGEVSASGAGATVHINNCAFVHGEGLSVSQHVALAGNDDRRRFEHAAFSPKAGGSSWFSWEAGVEKMGELGSEQLAWLERDTVLNGHIHQVVEHQEGNIRFASANATAYPQPQPGTAAAPGPVTLAHDAPLRVIGYRTVELHEGDATVRNVALG
jgi:hypothetical protein